MSTPVIAPLRQWPGAEKRHARKVDREYTGTEWQPIRTCPSDRRVLLCNAKTGWVWAGATTNALNIPTHWMPLPVAPGADPGDAPSPEVGISALHARRKGDYDGD